MTQLGTFASPKRSSKTHLGDSEIATDYLFSPTIMRRAIFA
jgi:hypothetical protein